MAPSVEDIAAVCRAKLRPCMLVTSQLLRTARTPRGGLISGMNDVLGAVVDSNFGAATHDHLARLYTSIAELQPAMADNREDLALLYFARSLAVVMEEAVRQREERLAERGREAYGREKKEGNGEEGGVEKEERIVEEQQQLQPERRTTVPILLPQNCVSSDKKSEEQTQEENRREEEMKERINARRAAATGATHAAPAAKPAAAGTTLLSGTEAWRMAMQRQRPDKILDFSLEAIEGRIIIFDVLACVREEEVRALLQPFGRIVEFYYPDEGRERGYVHAKFESNRAAYEAVAQLRNARLGGGAVRVKRAEYWTRFNPQMSRLQRLQLLQQQGKPLNALQQQSLLRSRRSKPVHPPVAAATAATVRCPDVRSTQPQLLPLRQLQPLQPQKLQLQLRPVCSQQKASAAAAPAQLVDSDDSDDEPAVLREDLSDSSFFSID